jgi:enoyl-CoA hydratase/carnithine racemase
LINAVCPDGQSKRAATKYASDIIANTAPESARAVVRSRRWNLESIEAEAARQVEATRLYLSPDFRRRAQAFLDSDQRAGDRQDGSSRA